LSYGEAAEMAYFGARLLHPRTVAPLRQQRIPLRIRNVFKPQQPGTLISDQFPTPTPVLKAVTSANGLGLSADRNEPLALIAAVVDDLLFNLTGSRADIMISAQSAEQSFACFVIPTTAGPDAVHTVRIAVEERLEQDKTLPWTVRPVNVITAIGSRMDETHTLIVQMFQALNGVRVLAMAQAPSRYSLSVVVDPNDSDRALAQIHDLIVKN
jgi:bifunctional aspartokinase / homoserine dehydrogenase 1